MQLRSWHARHRKAVFVGIGIFLTVVCAAGLLWRDKLLPPRAPVIFESAPRQVASGTDPRLTVRDTGDLYLLKVENGNLWYEMSRDNGERFGHPVRVNDMDGEVASHVEATPQLYLRGGKPYALWQTHPEEKPDSTKLRFARSTDYGESFTKAIDVDPSGLPASQSFFNMNVSPKGVVFVVWLDGRDKGGAPGSASVYLARSTDGGASFAKSVRVGLGACPCCRPSIAFTDENTVHIGFRKIFEGSVRDIVVSTSTDGGKSWGEPARVAADHWQINGCPHSGPSLAVLGKRLFISWFTVHAKEEQSFVLLAYSDDGGRTFSTPQWLSEGTLDANHPYLVNGHEKILAVFQGRAPRHNGSWGTVGVYYREVNAQGRVSPLVAVGNFSASVNSPTMAFEPPGHVFLAWGASDEKGDHIVLIRGRSAHNF